MNLSKDRSVTLCMVVKDEAARIANCLNPLVGQVDEILVADTGSTDSTIEILKDQFGITAIHDRLHNERCLTKIDVRNRLIGEARTGWILSIDADEVITAGSIDAFRKLPGDTQVAGYFGLWRNHLAETSPFDDYKCFLFRSDRRMRGLVHENAQSDLRSAGLRADWLPELAVTHYPAPDRHQVKTELYERRLRCALNLEPFWHRYDWFLGYMLFQQGRMEEAAAHLERAWESGNPLFPVERLNSAMVLTEIHSKAGRIETARAKAALAYAEWQTLAEDFEVRVNHRLGPWFVEAKEALAEGHLPPEAYRFAR